MSWIEMVADWESALIKELQQKADALRSKASSGGGKLAMNRMEKKRPETIEAFLVLYDAHVVGFQHDMKRAAQLTDAFDQLAHNLVRLLQHRALQMIVRVMRQFDLRRPVIEKRRHWFASPPMKP
jgi:hypothetical protein